MFWYEWDGIGFRVLLTQPTVPRFDELQHAAVNTLVVVGIGVMTYVFISTSVVGADHSDYIVVVTLSGQCFVLARHFAHRCIITTQRTAKPLAAGERDNDNRK